jgi:hypothetical protein
MMFFNKMTIKSMACLCLLSFVGCEDKIIQGVDNDLVTGQGNVENCSSKATFDGVDNISSIKDSSVALNRQAVTGSLGYSIFQKTTSGSLTFVKTISPGSTSYTVSNLTALSEYGFMVKSIDEDGLNDCNDKITFVTTLNKETFKSCLDIQTFYGNTEPSGSYEIDVDLEGPKAPFNVYCEMNYNGGGWTRLFVHKTAGGLFSSKNDAKEKNTGDIDADLYSQLIHLSDFKRDAKFEFWLNYNELDGNDGGNRWTQTSNPLTDDIAGYTAISADHTSRFWGGLEPDKGNNTLLDGSVGHSNWYYAIGSINYWPSSGTIPGPSSGINEAVLYIR